MFYLTWLSSSSSSSCVFPACLTSQHNQCTVERQIGKTNIEATYIFIYGARHMMYGGWVHRHQKTSPIQNANVSLRRAGLE